MHFRLSGEVFDFISLLKCILLSREVFKLYQLFQMDFRFSEEVFNLYQFFFSMPFRFFKEVFKLYHSSQMHFRFAPSPLHIKYKGSTSTYQLYLNNEIKELIKRKKETSMDMGKSKFTIRKPSCLLLVPCK